MTIWKKKGSGYLDLSEKMKVRERRVQQMKENFNEPVQETEPESAKENQGGFFGNFFGGNVPAPTPAETSEDNPGERKRKLAKRLMDMTSKIEELENTIYKMNQRIEILEKKQRLGY
jgi:hypothetical protein